MSIDNVNFYDFRLSEPILKSLNLLGYNTPTEIQNLAIPAIIQGQDVLGKSNTGTGKTAAFGIPICNEIQWNEFLPQALVLEPTRELADQVKTELFHIGRMKRIKIPILLGGMPIDKQLLSLKERSHIIVGTPGRIMDHVRRSSLNLSNIKYLVIDEADLLLNMGFLEEVQEIIQALPKERITMLFSATMNPEVLALSETCMKEPLFIEIQETESNTLQIKEQVYYVQQERKYSSLISILIQEHPENTMIFCATREMVNTLCHKMTRSHIRCGMLHGEMDQRERLQSIDHFRQGKFHYLICTDVAARGIDFDNITHVIHYDIPTGKETYVHRIGRTGRMNHSGTSICMVTSNEMRTKKIIEQYTQKKLLVLEPITNTPEETQLFWDKQKERPHLKPRKGAVFHKSITRLAIGGGKKSKMRTVDIVGTICSIDQISSDDIGIIEIRESISYVEILNGKGDLVFDALQIKNIKGKHRSVRKIKGL